MRHCLLFLGGLAACGGLETEPRQLSGFTQVDNESSLPISVTPGPFSVMVTADSNLQSRIVIQVTGTVLTITTDGILPMNDARVTVVLPVLTAVNESGSGSVTAGSFDLGSATFTVTGDGSGMTTLSGSCGLLSINAAGSGSVNASGLLATGAAVDVAGSGSVEITVSGDTDLTVRGSGSIEAALNGGSASFSVTGSGRLDWSGQTTVVSTSSMRAGSVRGPTTAGLP